MANESTVFLVDDDASLREALQWLVESIQLPVETFASAGAFLDAYDPQRAGCLVVDVRMPGMSGLDLQARLRQLKVDLPVIVITGHGDVPMCVRAFEGGAFAFLEKPVNHQRFLDHIQRAIEVDRQRRITPVAASRFTVLTDREREVMELLVDGKSMKQIATQLSISVQTCSKHRASVLNKLLVENDVELVRLVLAAQPEPK